MKKTLKFFFAGTFSLLLLAACEEKEVTEYVGGEYNDSYYAEQAGISCSDASFTATSDGGEARFKSSGGAVTVNVSCGTTWLVENSATDIFSTSMTSTTLEVKAGQSSIEEEVTGTIVFLTAAQRIEFATLMVTQSAYGSIEISVGSNEWSIPALGNLTTEIGVEATADWTAEPDDRWITAERTDAGVRLTAEGNEDTRERTSRVVLVCTDGVTTEYEYINVTQEARAYISLGVGSVSFGMEESSSSVTVESNYDWDYSCESDWFSVSRSGNSLTVTVKSNEGGDSREGVVTLTAGDGAENVTEAQLKVSQAGLSDMILTYNTTGGAVQLPLDGTVDCVVDWGDGTEPETVTFSFPSHTYDEVGEYDITISGTVTALNSYSLSSSGKVLPITAVKQWGKTGLTNMRYAFYVCQKLVSLPEYTGDAFAEVTDFYQAFFSCEALEEIPAGIFDKCTKATAFDFVFYDCQTLKTVPEGLFDNCVNATSFDAAFYNCISITEFPAGLFAKCENVTDFGYVIYGCHSLKHLPEEGIFGYHPKLESLAAALYDCFALEELPAGLFDGCAPGTDLQHLLHSCTSLKTLPAGIFDAFTETEGFHCSFSQCTGLEELPDGLFDKCTEMTDLYQAFYGNEALKKIPDGLFKYNTKLTNFQSTFARCSSVTEIPEDLFANCPDAENFAYTFERWTSLTSVPAGLFDHNLKATTFTWTFTQNSAMKGESPYTDIDGVKVHLYERANYPDIFAKPTSYSRCFYNCTALDDYLDIPSGWGGGGN